MGWHYWRYLREEEEKFERKISERELLKRLLRLISPYKHLIIFAILLSLVSIGTSIIMPYLTKSLADSIIEKNLEKLKNVSLIFLIIVIIRLTSRASYSYTVSWISNKVMYDIRCKMFNHLQKLKLSYFSKQPVGNIVSRITNDVSSIGNVTTSGAIELINEIVTLAGAIFMMFKLSFELTLIALLMIPLISLTSYIFALRARRAYRKTRKKIAEVTSRIEQDVAGATVLQTFVQRKTANIKEFRKLTRETLQVNLEATKAIASINPALNVIRAIGYSTILWYGSTLILQKKITIGTLIAFFGYVDMFFRPIMMLLTFYGTIQSALAAAERIFEFLDEEVEKEGKIALDEIKGEIIYEKVTFSYNEVPVLKNITLHIKPGERVAIVGPTGAGKTTLVSLLLRFYDNWKGRIAIDGIDIRKIRIHDLRKNVGFVPQEPLLFSGTILENIRIAKPDATRNEVIKAIERLGLIDLLETLPNGLDTMVLENGKNLSVGQRQLISFARAILANPKILIMDEATSSLDPITERKIQKAIRKLLENRTCIIIAHRLSTIKDVDKIFVMNNGEIVEEGTHDELLKKNGLYAKLYKIQLGQQELLINE